MENECFLFDQKGERRRIPYQKIYYMEAREKRVYARLENIEYGITDTIEHLAGILPKEFIRCHRSYIVNYIYIERVRYAENFILLRGSHILPLSRSYKAALKEVMSNA
jgi:DNA-binding LytR/AlgR family response regulator